MSQSSQVSNPPSATAAWPRPLQLTRLRCTNCGLIQAVRGGVAMCPECGHTRFNAA